ncbi:hypothetical protein GWI33_018224 [Rhynchophorus ferrugineus]|uniref:Uncharacterized protein n=1 Tax=Rhynchophorus ferrugineus TaxID=354439 RepID=A0A834HWT4_RHYFE|nr:hypothetical protein GWI33_018224 [Rhynchophorus ferrugineus]
MQRRHRPTKPPPSPPHYSTHTDRPSAPSPSTRQSPYRFAHIRAGATSDLAPIPIVSCPSRPPGDIFNLCIASPPARSSPPPSPPHPPGPYIRRRIANDSLMT